MTLHIIPCFVFVYMFGLLQPFYCITNFIDIVLPIITT